MTDRKLAELEISRRFRGPPASANGGYFAGRVARLADRTVRMRLLAPPPLETKLELIEADGQLEVRRDQERIAEAEPAELELPRPPAVEYLQAVEASRHYAGFHTHAFPSCFVCGPQRLRGDGLRIFPGPVARGEAGCVAAPWVPDESLAEPDGKIAPEFVSAALDCPGYFAVSEGRVMLLAELTAHIDRRVRPGESCVVVGWPMGTSGRKRRAGTALYDEDGELCARALALWIEPRTA